MMVVPNSVCPKFHDYWKTSVSVRRSQEFRQSAARFAAAPQARRREWHSIARPNDGERKASAKKLGRPAALLAPQSREKQIFRLDEFLVQCRPR
jgi:hypothetical protein